MLEQWEADRLLSVAKIYSRSTSINLTLGAEDDYQIEDAEGTEFFLLDIWCSSRNKKKARFQLRYRRSVVLARLCTAAGHTNPDGQIVPAPHPTATVKVAKTSGPHHWSRLAT